MLCAQCEVQARGTCRFCGRGTCADHHSTLPYIITVFGAEPPRSIVVSGTLWCGICRPQPEPIAMPELA
jgi:hypothetical protein